MSKGPVYSSFQGSDGETPIVVTSWLPDIEPIGVIQIVHGMREHMGRYDHFARYLCDEGFIVYGHDHMGHGRTALNWGIYGYFGEEKGAKNLVDDSNYLTRYLSATYPELPLFIIGHSMGSFVSRLQILHTADLLNGYICLGTGGDNPAAPLARAYAGALAGVKGPDTTSVILDKGLDSTLQKGLGIEEENDDWISHDPETIKAYREDPYSRFHFTNKGYADLMDLQIAANEPEWFERVCKNLPIHFASGNEDPVSMMGRDIPKLEKRLKDNGVVDVSYKVYDGFRHEILNEVDRYTVYGDLVKWIKERISTDDNEMVVTDNEA